jgi:simple sugar transport system ATP-binding protein
MISEPVPRTATPTPLLETRDVVVSFGHIQALRGASMQVRPREIVALVGDNGAGKSTLVKAISGVRPPDSGDLLRLGERVEIASPAMSRALGIEVVYQDLAVAPHLDPVENLFLGRQRRRGGIAGRLGVIDRRRMREEAATAFETLGVSIKDLTVPISELSGGQRQAVAVARAAHWATGLIIMDEPTAALGPVQTEKVGEMIRRVREQGLAILLVSHDLPQVLELSDRVVVLRQGKDVASAPASQLNVRDVVDLMSGAVAAHRGSE